jgi:hypothetical protein
MFANPCETSRSSARIRKGCASAGAPLNTNPIIAKLGGRLPVALQAVVTATENPSSYQS